VTVHKITDAEELTSPIAGNDRNNILPRFIYDVNVPLIYCLLVLFRDIQKNLW